MIKRLRFKFVIITMGVLLLVFAVMFAAINIFMHQSSARETDRLLNAIATQDGITFFGGRTDIRTRPMPDKRERAMGGRFFYGKVDEQGAIWELRNDMMFDMTDEEADEYIDRALAQGQTSGAFSNLRYLVAEKDYGKIVVLAETNVEMGMLEQLINLSIFVAGGSFLILLALSILLSRWVTAPVKVAFEKQREFVSDAGHELKTPLTALSANADVLESEIGTNRWLMQIKAQAQRMDLLVEDLLSLSRTDEEDFRPQMIVFDWSKAVLSAALEYESTAFEAGKTFTSDIRQGINAIGNEQRIRQLVSILLDNALKHSEDAASIDIALRQEEGKITLCVYNTGMGITDEEKQKVFERFYRADASRSRETGGYGLGLAIAKSIVELHKGKITVESEYGKWIRFIASF